MCTTRRLSLLALLTWSAWTVGCPAAGDDDDAAGDDDDAAGPDLAELAFAGFDEWSEPIEDYEDALQAEYGGEGFHHSIWDLAVYLDRLYLGYGDADINAGRVFPIEPRYLADPGDPDGWTADFAVDDEMIEQYRQFDGDDGLYVAGIDATEDDLIGNAYHRTPDEGWTKSRTLEYALHVHDIARFGGAVYCVGSGSTWEEYEAFTISSMFWRSDDGGDSFEVVEKLIHPDVGDARWTRLLPVGDELYLFGHRTDGQYINDLIPHVFDGDALAEAPELDSKWVWNSWPVEPERGLITGVTLGFGSMKHEAFLVEPGGELDHVDELDGETLVDAVAVGDGRWLLLARAGDVYGDPAGAAHRVLLTGDFDDFVELATYDGTDPLPTALAVWHDALYLGMDDGTIWRAEGE